jgi:hypothetical protein
MTKPPTFFVLVSFLVWSSVQPVCAQTATAAPPATNTAASTAPSGQAPDDATKKITELVHTGSYAEAQKLTTGLLVAYPDDQRLIKAKALIEKLLAPGGSTSSAPTNNPPAQPAANTNPEQLTGMDKVDYSALLVLARQAQQTTDLAEQTKLLKQFMDQSDVFLQKHPDQMLLWQFRGQLAISLNEPKAGFEAGQKLMAAGAADSNDPNLQQLLGELKNKGWLDRQTAEKHAKYDWILGSWKVSWSVSWHARGVWPANFGAVIRKGHGTSEEFSISGSAIEGYEVRANGEKSARPNIRGTILGSGEIRWEQYYWPTGGGSYLISYHTAIGWKIKPGTTFYPSGFVPVISCVIDNDKQTMTMVIPSQDTSETSPNPMNDTVTLVYTKAGNT